MSTSAKGNATSIHSEPALLYVTVLAAAVLFAPAATAETRAAPSATPGPQQFDQIKITADGKAVQDGASFDHTENRVGDGT